MIASVDSENPSEPQRCSATKVDGTPCRAWAVLNGLCVGHQPGAAAARSKGGHNSSKTARLEAKLPARLRPVVELLEKAMHEVHEGKLTPQQGSAIASLAGALIKSLEHGDLEIRLADLEPGRRKGRCRDGERFRVTAQAVGEGHGRRRGCADSLSSWLGCCVRRKAGGETVGRGGETG